MSRLEGSIWGDKPMLLLATSPGKRGGITVLNTATASFAFWNNAPIYSFSLPGFHNNFSDTEGIKDPELDQAFRKQLEAFTETVRKSEMVSTLN